MLFSFPTALWNSCQKMDGKLPSKYIVSEFKDSVKHCCNDMMLAYLETSFLYVETYAQIIY